MGGFCCCFCVCVCCCCCCFGEVESCLSKIPPAAVFPEQTVPKFAMCHSKSLLGTFHDTLNLKCKQIDVHHETCSEGQTKNQKFSSSFLQSGALGLRATNGAQRHTCTYLGFDANFAQFRKLGLWGLGQKF